MFISKLLSITDPFGYKAGYGDNYIWVTFINEAIR